MTVSSEVIQTVAQITAWKEEAVALEAQARAAGTIQNPDVTSKLWSLHGAVNTYRDRLTALDRPDLAAALAGNVASPADARTILEGLKAQGSNGYYKGLMPVRGDTLYGTPSSQGVQYQAPAAQQAGPSAGGSSLVSRIPVVGDLWQAMLGAAQSFRGVVEGVGSVLLQVVQKGGGIILVALPILIWGVVVRKAAKPKVSLKAGPLRASAG